MRLQNGLLKFLGKIESRTIWLFYSSPDKCFVILVTFCLCTAVQPNDKQWKLAHWIWKERLIEPKKYTKRALSYGKKNENGWSSHKEDKKIKEAHTKIERQVTTKRNSAECGQYKKFFSFWKSASGRFCLVHLQPPQLHRFKTLFFPPIFQQFPSKKLEFFLHFYGVPHSKKPLGNIPPSTRHRAQK